MINAKAAIELVLGLLVAVVALSALARSLKVVYPVMLVLGGLALGFVPGLPQVRMEPDLVLLVFLPPLLYSASWLLSWRELRAVLSPILLLAVGLVLVTIFAVGLVAHATLPAIAWGAALTLGAIVSPTDAVAATAVAQRLNAPHRLVTIIEGESLVNDATGLVAFQLAIASVVIGHWSLPQAALKLAWVSVAGIGIGLATAWASDWLLRWLHEPTVEIAWTAITAYAAYLAGDAIGASGVLSCMAAGLYGGWRAPISLGAETRLQASAVWETLTFLLNGLVFVLLGLQLRAVVAEVATTHVAQLAWAAVAVSAATIVIRILWTFAAFHLPPLVSRKARTREPRPSWRLTLAVGWSGMRGVVSLATALALPVAVAGGRPFPARSLVAFLAFAVILATLVFQGLTLPLLLKRLGVSGDVRSDREELQARYAAVRAALAELEQLCATSGGARESELEGLRTLYADRAAVLEARAFRQGVRLEGEGPVPQRPAPTLEAERRWELARDLRVRLLHAQRQVLIGMRNRQLIGDNVLRRVERDLDLEETGL